MEEKLIMPNNSSKGVKILNLIRNGVLVERKCLYIDFSLKYNSYSNDWIRKSIDTIWEEACQNNAKLYNRSKFRLYEVSLPINNQITLQIGLTSYKELMATNCHSFGRHLIEYARQSLSSDRSCLADVLGVGSLLRTSDNKFLFIKRALWTGEDKGKLDRPGGHPEPDNISHSIHRWSEENCKKPENREKIRDEIFNSVLYEIRDEINIPVETLTDPVLLGIVRSVERLGRPSAEFLVQCSLSSEEVRHLYTQNSQSEADETLDILFLNEEDVRLKKLPSFIWSDLTDAACGAI